MVSREFLENVARQKVGLSIPPSTAGSATTPARPRRGGWKRIKYGLIALVLGASVIYGAKGGLEYYNAANTTISQYRAKDKKNQEAIRQLEETVEKYSALSSRNEGLSEELMERINNMNEQIKIYKRDYINKRDLEGVVRQIITDNDGDNGAWIVGARGEGVYIQNGATEAVLKTPKITLKVYIDSRAGKDMAFFNEALAKASENLYLNFNIRLDWDQQQFYPYTSSANSTEAEFDLFERMLQPNDHPGDRSVYVLFYRGENNDGCSGMAQHGRGRVIVDSNHDINGVLHTIVHEFGHVFGLDYNSKDKVHLDIPNFVMSYNHNRSMMWDDESRRQIWDRINAGRLDHVLTYR